MKHIEKLDTITGFLPFPDGSVHDTRILADKINEIISALQEEEEKCGEIICQAYGTMSEYVPAEYCQNPKGQCPLHDKKEPPGRYYVSVDVIKMRVEEAVKEERARLLKCWRKMSTAGFVQELEQ